MELAQEKQIEELLKQVEELHSNMIRIKEGKSLMDSDVIIESQILDIVLNNYHQTLAKKLDKQSMCG